MKIGPQSLNYVYASPIETERGQGTWVGGTEAGQDTLPNDGHSLDLSQSLDYQSDTEVSDSLLSESSDTMYDQSDSLGNPSEPTTQLTKRAVCAYNFPTRRTLCDSTTSGSLSLEIGSANGQYAFLWADGNPRIVYGPKATVKWNSGIYLPKNVGCSKYATRFELYGVINLRCLSTNWLTLRVRNSAGILPKKITIGNFGVVRFYSAKNVLLLTIAPNAWAKPSPLANWQAVVRKATTTSKTSTKTKTRTLTRTTTSRTRTTTRTTTTSYIPTTATPDLHPSNYIVKPGCRYLAVPFDLPLSSSAQSNVYNIELISCSSNTTFDPYFISAARKWMSLITADLPDRDLLSSPLSNCIADNDGTPILSCGYVDDLIIAYDLLEIDGVDGSIGASAPQYYRSESYLPFTAYMSFDIADLDSLLTSGLLADVILHEMAHALGFGTTSSFTNLINPSNCLSLSPPFIASFTGSHTNSSLSQVDPTHFLTLPSVQLEDLGGNGTQCIHFHEESYQNELMTAWISPNNGNPLSLLTANAFKDMGYSVDLTSSVVDWSYNVATASNYDLKPGADVKANEVGLGDCLKGWDVNRMGSVGADGLVLKRAR